MTTSAPVLPPDHQAFVADIEKADFRLAVLERRFRLIKVAWPLVLVGVYAAGGREYVLRFNCTGYPRQPPTAGLWNLDTNTVLEPARWPAANGGRVAAVFNRGWKGGIALYLPCDREAIEGHDNWRHEMPSKLWRPADGIIQYLEQVHELLHSRDYVVPPHG